MRQSVVGALHGSRDGKRPTLAFRRVVVLYPCALRWAAILRGRLRGWELHSQFFALRGASCDH
eukprot:9933720-Lingulodinium_polyedra.AAC.1